MTSIKKLSVPLLNGIMIILLSVLTVNKLSPGYLNADVILTSVMSLQNVTLFYWGQNRLANFIPFLASIIKNPEYNLLFILYFSAAIHYSLLFFLSKLSTELYCTDNEKFMGMKVFTVISLIFLLSVKDKYIFSIAIWHIEYSLPVLLILWLFERVIDKNINTLKFTAIAVLLVAIATGINFSIVIVSCCLVGAYSFFIKKINYHAISFFTVSVISYFLWIYLSNKMGDFNYTGFYIDQLPTGIVRVAGNIIEAISLSNIAFITLIFSIYKLICLSIDIDYNKASYRNVYYTIYSIAAFCMGWIILFSSCKWIRLNNYSYRYFTFIFYGIFFIVTIQILKIFRLIGNRTSWLIATVSFVLILINLWSNYIQVNEYKIFKQFNIKSSATYSLYSGNYWAVWPSVFRDMMSGKQSIGLTYRGEGNKEKANKLIKKQLALKGKVSIYCLDESTDNCREDISNYIDHFFVKKIKKRSKKINEMVLTLSDNK